MDLRPTSTLSRLTAVSAAVLLVVGLAGCGSDDNTSTGSGDGATTTTGADSSGADEYVVVAKDIAFQNDLTVEADEEFTFDNQDTTTHTLTADDGSFDSGEIAGGSQSDPLTPPTEPGDYPFHCEIHASMTGTLTVK